MMKTSKLAPIVIFAFNRPYALKTTLESLQANIGSKSSILYVFVDGPRLDNSDDSNKVFQVQDLVRHINGFKQVHYVFSDKNKGLAKSIIDGTTEVLRIHGKAIVVEDDLFLSKSFLRYMNKMLDEYENDKRVMQISGYTTKINIPDDYSYDIYLNIRAQSWSWATWYDRWITVDWEVNDYIQLKAEKKMQKAFCKGGSDLFNMLRGYMEGRNNSWYIRFCYSMHKQQGYSICPIRSLVRNDGFTQEATHCNVYNRYKISFEEMHLGEFVTSPNIQPNKKIQKEAIKYWSLRWRLIGKFVTALLKLFK